ncbi:tol-pal system protein YbgF [Aestuariivirga sp.]|uniref:tol-pal system protein YbgF n=1 Tax=Aestuariivirga sp. TaxID=2650926 RepID=UPI00391C121F
MLKYVKSSVAAAALLGVLVSPATAQSASEMAVRMQQLEEQVRQLTGQVQELSFEVKQLRAQSGAGAAQQSGAVQQLQQPKAPAVAAAEPPQPSQQKRLAAASAGEPIADSNDIEVIDQQPIGGLPMPPQGAEADISGVESGGAPGPTVLGALDNAAAQPNDGGFQGKVLVPPSQQEPGDEIVFQQGNMSAGSGSSDSIETVALAPEASGESPESLYERSNESLLRRQFGDAEAGFSTFLQKYPDHSLAGSAQYWLGETFYAQSDFKRAAANFLQGYKKYPKSRRAPESLLKLGISLKRLGQDEQACAAYAAVSAEYPKAVDARKRAQAEAKRAGCGS